MSAPPKVPFVRILRALLVLAALVLILNPEVRALFLLTNALGFEVLGVLVALQLRALLSLDGVYPVAEGCKLASRVGYLALVAYPRAASCPVFSRLLCPALITVAYGLCCQPFNNRWRGA
jgi:hypothetical protein